MGDFYEFFAGGGMVRAGLGQGWRCVFANDFDPKKARVYRENWGDAELNTDSVETLVSSDLPGQAQLAWASFPCQDLSVAGSGAGLKGGRSGTFLPFWKLMKALVEEKRAPSLIVIENVSGTLTSHQGRDFATICRGFVDAGYSLGAIIIDAVLFVPQSRPRLFVIAVKDRSTIPNDLIAAGPLPAWHNKTLRTAFAKLPKSVQAEWIWWNLPLPRTRRLSFADIIENEPTGTEWFSETETNRLVGMMSKVNRLKLLKVQQLGRPVMGGVYKRTRRDEAGRAVQRAEIRFDNISGCLRTPAGGSSRQIILTVNGELVKARLISARETARLMGLQDSYKLPENYNEAYHLTGDGVVVPVVRHLAKYIFEPILDFETKKGTLAA
ncbi:MAG TPA: DNA cytosine methyltransferase [Pyrinomonadaceae bacterium]|nr:DNA cytosine methyltransferase [Pyrinomonadaceae bacterium]